MSTDSGTPPGWYPDPSGAPQSRWWDGTTWSEHTAASQPARYPILPAAPPTKRIWLQVLLGVLVALLLLVGGCVALVGTAAVGVSKAVDKAKSDYNAAQAAAAKEVKLESCDVTPVAPGATAFERVAKGTVTNGSSIRSGYYIKVVFEDGSGRLLADSFALVEAEPGQTASWSAIALSNNTDASRASCRIVDVTRHATASR